MTAGGVLLPDSAKEKPIAGTVIATGPGRQEEDGTRKEPRVAKGDQVRSRVCILHVVLLACFGVGQQLCRGSSHVQLRVHATCISWRCPLKVCLMAFNAVTQVLYFKWAGDAMETPSGEKYVVVHEQVGCVAVALCIMIACSEC